MEKKPIDALHLIGRLHDEPALSDSTMDAVRQIMNLKFQTMIETEPTVSDVVVVDGETVKLSDMTSMQVHFDEHPHGLYCRKCGARLLLNYEWIEDGAAAAPNFCPVCGRAVAHFAEDEVDE